MNLPIHATVQDLLRTRLAELESHFQKDVLAYFGGFFDSSASLFLRLVEELAADSLKKDELAIILTSTGGSVETVERFVNILRHHYKVVDFIVPDYAYSAGTIFCMSGDSIHMDYFSVLGPIDPQVQNKEGRWVPALGYLDKVNELIGKGGLSNAELLMLQNIDLAELSGFEQAKDLTIELLKKWLCAYKFKNWVTHRTDPQLKGQGVTAQQKETRAEEIAEALSNNQKWKSHGRPISIFDLKELRLEIDDYSKLIDRRRLIRDYYFLAIDYMQKNNYSFFIHTRCFL